MSKRNLALTAVVAATAVITLVLMFTGHRAKADSGESAATPAAVATARRIPLEKSVTLSGEFVPFQQVDVHAKVAGYISKIFVDVGDHVKTGQTLAVLEVPELQAQLQGAGAGVHRAEDAMRRAQSDIERAKSLHTATHLDYTRLQQASQARPGLIAQQELDDALAKDQESEAQVAADEAALAEAKGALEVARADETRYTALAGYTRIVAPFTGVITKRWVDTGALVQAGTNSNTQALPVVSIAETDLFRLTLPVPESAVPMIRPGSVVRVHVQALDRDFDGKVARVADDLSPETRTMHSEVDVRNHDGTIVPGMYAEVRLRLVRKDGALVVPVEAVSHNGSEPTVMYVGPDNKIEERQVTLGMEGANEVEIAAGLNEADRVVIGNRSQFRAGEIIEPKPINLRKTAQEF